jgi:hypothetical protein
VKSISGGIFENVRKFRRWHHSISFSLFIRRSVVGYDAELASE